VLLSKSRRIEAQHGYFEVTRVLRFRKAVKWNSVQHRVSTHSNHAGLADQFESFEIVPSRDQTHSPGSIFEVKIHLTKHGRIRLSGVPTVALEKIIRDYIPTGGLCYKPVPS
jgi:hypothetical protein